MEELVVRETFFKSPATAPENRLDGVDHTFAGRPQDEGMMQQSGSFPLITKPMLSNPVGLGEGLVRCQSTLALVDQREPTHNHKQVLCPSKNREVVNLSGLPNTMN